MPNWCSNELVIYEKDTKIAEKIWKEITNDDCELDFEMIIPIPDDPAYRDEPNQQEAKKSPNWWYNWNVKNWGTKWNACDTDSYWDGIDTIEFSFGTAWSPPTPIVRALAEKYPTSLIGLFYREESMGFQGSLVLKGDEVIEEKEIETCMTKEDMKWLKQE